MKRTLLGIKRLKGAEDILSVVHTSELQHRDDSTTMYPVIISGLCTPDHSNMGKPRIREVAQMVTPRQCRCLKPYAVNRDRIMHVGQLSVDKDVEYKEIEKTDDMTLLQHITQSSMLEGKKIKMLVAHDTKVAMELVDGYFSAMPQLYRNNFCVGTTQRDVVSEARNALQSGVYDIDSFEESMSLCIMFIEIGVAMRVFDDDITAMASTISTFMRNGSAERAEHSFGIHASCVHTNVNDGLLVIDGKPIYSFDESFGDLKDRLKESLGLNLNSHLSAVKKKMNAAKSSNKTYVIRRAEAM